MQAPEMKEATAQQGFTQFVMNNNTARMFLDIHIETYTEIGAFSGGYYSKNALPGWDQQWDTISIGNSVEDAMTIDGLMLMADFDGDTSTLQRIVFGSNRLQGDLTATFNSYSGTYNNALVTEGVSETITQDRLPIGDAGVPTTFHFNSDADPDNNMGLFFILNMNDPDTMDGFQQQGLQVVAGFDDKAMETNPWWDKP